MTMSVREGPPPLSIEDRRRRPFTILDNCIFDLGLSCQAIAVYAVLCRYASYNRGRAYPSIDTIAQKAGVGKTTVKKFIAELERQEIIMVDRHTVGKTKRRNIYYLLDLGGLTASEETNPPEISLPEKNTDMKSHVARILEKMMEAG